MNIDTSKLPGNSNLQKASVIRENTIETKAVAKARVRQRSAPSRFSEAFIIGDIKSVSGFVLEKVIIPNLQRLAVDTINSVARGIFMGEGVTNSVNPLSKPSGNGVTSYNSMFSGNQSKATIKRSSQSDQLSFGELIFDTYGEARLVLDQMDECLAESGVVTVADMYGFADATCPFTGNFYGWNNISSANVVPDQDGWKIKMPRCREIKD